MFVLNQINDGQTFSLVCSESIDKLVDYCDQLDESVWLDNSEDLEGDGMVYNPLIWVDYLGGLSADSSDGYVRYEIQGIGVLT